MRIKLLIALFMIVQLSFSQEGLSPGQIADYQNELMFKELDLTEEQQTKVSKINLKYAPRQKTLMEKEGSMFSKIGDIKKIKKEKDTELKGVMTEVQFEKFKDEVEPKIRSYMKKNMKK